MTLTHTIKQIDDVQLDCEVSYDVDTNEYVINDCILSKGDLKIDIGYLLYENFNLTEVLDKVDWREKWREQRAEWGRVTKPVPKFITLNTAV